MGTRLLTNLKVITTTTKVPLRILIGILLSVSVALKILFPDRISTFLILSTQLAARQFSRKPREVVSYFPR